MGTSNSNAKPEFFQEQNLGGAEHPQELLALIKVQHGGAKASFKAS